MPHCTYFPAKFYINYLTLIRKSTLLGTQGMAQHLFSVAFILSEKLWFFKLNILGI